MGMIRGRYFRYVVFGDAVLCVIRLRGLEDYCTSGARGEGTIAQFVDDDEFQNIISSRSVRTRNRDPSPASILSIALVHICSTALPHSLANQSHSSTGCFPFIASSPPPSHLSAFDVDPS